MRNLSQLFAAVFFSAPKFNPSGVNEPFNFVPRISSGAINIQALQALSNKLQIPKLPKLRFPSIHQSINPSIHQSINPSIHQSINPSIHQSINPSIHQSINP
ncbi:MAG: hypothetical protein ABIQ88_02750, partial [Chitinophagaceae bacterium]